MIDLGINLFQEIAALGGGGGYSISNSLRFNDDDSAYLRRTPATAGNRKTWTWSGWVKRGNLAAPGFYVLFEARNAGTTPYGLFYFYDDEIRFLDSLGGSVSSSAKLRDTSGWYHLICVLDTTQATTSDRVKIYVNGEQITSFSTATYPSLNQDLTVNTTYAHGIGAQPKLSDYFDGYMAEVNFIDGQALTADDFGQIDATTGEWSPIAYEGTYGTNGFYLPFNGNANDDSGNGNNWTENNLASTDYMIDTPTNNFGVLNPLNVFFGTPSLSEGNLKTTTTVNAFSTILNNNGKWYFELLKTDTTSGSVGIDSRSSGGSQYYLYDNDGVKNSPSTGAVSYGATFTTNDVISVAFDLDLGSVEFYKNGVSQGVAFSGIPEEIYAMEIAFPAVANFGADSSFAGNKTRQGNTDANGKGDFYYEPPSGFLALCEDNLELIPFVATGGTETTISDGGINYKVHTFTSSGTFEVTSGYKDVEYLVVAGGGSGGDGGDGGGGGGGAGGYRSSVFGESSGGGASAEPKLAVSAGSYTVTVGAGGAGGSRNNGSNSSLGTIISTGGGSGGKAKNGNIDGSLGGSGGGGSGSTFDSSNGGSGTTGQGYSGGNGRSGTSDSQRASGGGGGAGEAGDNGVTGKSGDGGDGLESSISGSATFYAGGGGGGARTAVTPGVGGLGGGGDGGSHASPVIAATAGEQNTGGGGSAARLLSEITAGGSGIVIIRYAV